MENGESLAFTPYKYKRLAINGRLIRAATEFFTSTPEGGVSETELSEIARYRDEPLGMWLTGHTCVAPEGRTGIGQNVIYDDRFSEGHRKLAQIIHSFGFGTKVVMQLGHGGIKAMGLGGLKILSPDGMTEAEIADAVRSFASAAKRAKDCGYDGVELHAAHRYLLSQFFYPEFNHRADRYGGSAVNRFRITAEVAEAVRAVCGDDFPIFMKINGGDACGSSEYRSDLAEAASIAEKCGIDGIEVSGYVPSPRGVPDRPFNLDNAAALLDSCGLPLILTGGIRTVGDIESLLERGFSAVSICRPYICDPKFTSRLYGGQPARCTCCGLCLADGRCHTDRSV